MEHAQDMAAAAGFSAAPKEAGLALGAMSSS
jgi:hypothetical protein